MVKPKKPKFEVCIGKEWCKCRKAVAMPSGWLHYELYDGTVGLAQPKNWRFKDDNAGK